jgi:hypothetical protein
MNSQDKNKLPLHALLNFEYQNRPSLCAFVNSQNQNKHHHAFVSSQDQKRPTLQIHELLNPKQTHIM